MKLKAKPRKKPARVDFLGNGGRAGSRLAEIGRRLGQGRFDPGMFRPFLANEDEDDAYVSLYNGFDKKGKRLYKTIQANASTSASLLREEWKHLDRAVIEAAMPRLRAWQDLAASSTLNVPGGMGKTVVESMRTKDLTPAKISMDGVAESDNDILEGDTIGVPLPIIHKDFKFSLRQVEVSRQGQIPLDTTHASAAAEKVAEECEKLTIGIGVGQGYGFSGYKIYGYASFPDRLTYELSDPTSPGWSPKVLVREIIGMKKAAEDVGYYGPYVLYITSDWSAYLDEDYSDVKGGNTTRQRIEVLDNISRITTLDYLDGFQMILVQLTPKVARAIVALPMTTLQWEQKGGMELRLKVMAIMVPDLRADFYNGTGIVHGNVPTSS